MTYAQVENDAEEEEEASCDENSSDDEDDEVVRIQKIKFKNSRKLGGCPPTWA